MNARHTWTWLIAAGVLFAFIFFFERHWKQPPPPSAVWLPQLKPESATRVLISLEAAPTREIRLEVTNANWWITQPILYPAQKSAVELLLTSLQQISPATTISRSELKQRANAEEEFGLNTPQASLVIQQEGYEARIKFGRRTAPGDQVFVQVVGREDIFVMDADLLKLLPAAPDAWRDRSLLALSALKFDALSITNNTGTIMLRRDPTNQVWRIVSPLPTRADTLYVEAMLHQLQDVRVSGFVSDTRRADLDTLGLQPPALSIALSQGNAPVALLQFGKTNAAWQCYARRDDLNTIVTVPAEIVAPWQQGFYGFRDRQLFAPPVGIKAIEVHGPENFTLERTGSIGWQVVGEKFPVDAARVQDFLSLIGGLEIVSFTKDVVSAAEFGSYGLTSAVRQVSFKLPASADGVTNQNNPQLEFGATAGEVVYARRSDEASVFGIKLADFQNLPVGAWQFRERRIWNFDPDELVRLTVRKGGYVREMIRGGTNSWSLAPGSQGVLDLGCTGELVRQLAQLHATAWSARGAAAAQDGRFGFGTNSLQLTLEMKTGNKLEVQFGGYSPARYPYARVTLDGELWVFEPWVYELQQFLLSCFAVPPGAP